MTCQCDQPGFCQRHKIHKHQRWWELCHGPHFTLWEQGRGPGQTGTQPDYIPHAKQKIEQGRAAWKALHSYRQAGPWNPDQARNDYAQWKKMIPTGYGCSCNRHWQEIEQRTPPIFEFEQAYWMWGFERHNEVNERLAKPKMCLAEAVAVWRRWDR